MTILTLANQKGGVGKTTTAVTLAHGLALAGQRTLLVDLDPQGHVAFALGMDGNLGRQMHHPDRGFPLVHILPSRTARTGKLQSD